jgi:AcrR family transcriptional regulator
MPRSPGPRGAYAKTAKRRQEIVAAAMDVFARHGYPNSTMSQIAKRAGMTMPGVTHHFPTKSALVEAVLRERDLDSQAHLEGRRGLDLLRGLLEVADRDEQQDGLTQLFTILAAEGTVKDHPAHAYLRYRYELILSAVQRAFEEAQANGDLRDGVVPAEAAQLYAALSDGLQLQHLYGVGQVGQTALMRGFLDSIIISPLGSAREP